ncbi:FAD-dependent oxidoreductase [Microbacterium sp. 2FI]|uniref:protoporphyrinogen/coproporphyrinogen oxidase n=1 Tax=Microbacterium sp. 2FI TaxID=2502193 RepID=UPI0010F6E196|nr:FAD-dependent oxidoreductase [Microbacterium sp. 2FI]
MTDFQVVGGGVAGLVLARRLAIAGADVVVYEASDRLGGTVAGHVVGGIAMDAGAESFAVRGGTVAALLGELGLAGDIVEPRPGPAWLQPASGDPVPLPATALLGIPADPLAADVVRVIGAAAAARAVDLDARTLGAIDPGATLGSLVRERLGEALLERLVAPVVHGVHSQHPDDLPLERAHPGLRTALTEVGSLSGAVARLRADAPPGSAVAGIRGGVHRLVTALAADLDRLGVDVRLGTRIDDAHALGGTVVAAAPGVWAPAAPGRRIDLITLVVDQDEWDAAPYGAPPQTPGSLTRAPNGAPPQTPGLLTRAPNGAPPQTPGLLTRAPRGSGLLVAHGAPVTARALTHATAKWEWLREAAGDHHVLRLSYDALPADPVATARTDAEVLLGVRIPTVVDAAHVTWVRPASTDAASRPADPAPTVGETVAGSGLAGIIAHAERTATGLLAHP